MCFLSLGGLLILPLAQRCLFLICFVFLSLLMLHHNIQSSSSPKENLIGFTDPVQFKGTSFTNEPSLCAYKHIHSVYICICTHMCEVCVCVHVYFWHLSGCLCVAIALSRGRQLTQAPHLRPYLTPQCFRIHASMLSSTLTEAASMPYVSWSPHLYIYMVIYFAKPCAQSLQH